MRAKNLVPLLFTMVAITVSAQRSDMALAFSAIDSAAYMQIDSIRIMNRSNGTDTVLVWPDTVLLLYAVGVEENPRNRDGSGLIVSCQNPVMDDGILRIYLPERERLLVTVSDAVGRRIISSGWNLDQGLHTFRFSPGGNGIYLLSASCRNKKESLKIVSTTCSSHTKTLVELIGSDDKGQALKQSSSAGGFIFWPGDTLLYAGYAGGKGSGMIDNPDDSRAYTFQFASNIACPGMPEITYNGTTYNTIQVFSQCWLKENLNVGTMIPGYQDAADNGVREKYCYDDYEVNCDLFGGLYSWDEMMQYSASSGARGICPPGWHVPTTEEFKILEGAVDSEFGIGDPEWDLGWEYRGTDAGHRLKSDTGWIGNGSGIDMFGFRAIPAGCRFSYGLFDEQGMYSYFWTSSGMNSTIKWSHRFFYDTETASRNSLNKGFGFSVRCVRDPGPETEFIELSFTAIDSCCFVPLDRIKVKNLTGGGSQVLYYPDTIIALGYTSGDGPTGIPGNRASLGFTPGDKLLVIGYFGELETGKVVIPDSSQTYTFHFAWGRPCPGIPTVNYAGQAYNTIQVFDQCWLKENLNVGTMVSGDQDMADNGVIEKYCFENDPYYCDLYGGLYQWNELMQYTATEGAQGICPPGWHIPSDEEWKVLEGIADSQYGIGDQMWNYWGDRGHDAGHHLKSTTGWCNYWGTIGNGSDTYGFNGLPAGYRHENGNFYAECINGGWATSSVHPQGPWGRHLFERIIEVTRYNEDIGNGWSARCLKD